MIDKQKLKQVMDIVASDEYTLGMEIVNDKIRVYVNSAYHQKHICDSVDLESWGLEVVRGRRSKMSK